MRYGFDYITSGSYAGDWSELFFPVDTTVTLTTTKGDSVTTTFTEGTSIVGTYVGINISSGGIIAYRRSDTEKFSLFTGLLDDYPATAAYSLRLLDSTYTGSAIRVRESSGNTEADIGFVGGELDTASLLSHCGANDGFVVTWYDQSGNSRDATQATAGRQPKIVSGGSVVLENGEPALDFDGTDDELSISVANDFFGLNDITALFVTKNATFSETGGLLQKRNAVLDGNFGVGSLNGEYQFQTRDSGTGDIIINTVSTYSTQQIVSILRNGDGIQINRPETITGAGSKADLTSTGGLTLGNGPSYGSLDGTIQEAILYLSDQSANRTAIESNINSHYSIYP